MSQTQILVLVFHYSTNIDLVYHMDECDRPWGRDVDPTHALVIGTTCRTYIGPKCILGLQCRLTLY